MITGALNSAVSALVLNASRLGAVADNLANVRTTGYKATDVDASTLVTRQTAETAYAAGGVLGRTRPSVSIQGLLEATPQTTDLAVSGQGFFPVQGEGGTLYTRSGAFHPDTEGFLANSAGYQLLGRPTNADGTINGGLTPINLERLAGSAEATSRTTVGANLPAGDAVGVTHRLTAQVHDSLGSPLNLDLSFEKTGTNLYTLTIADPTLAEGGETAGTAELSVAGGGPYAVGLVFEGDGKLSGFDLDLDGSVDADAPPSLFVGGLTTGGNDLDISLNLHGEGELDGLTQYGGPFTVSHTDADGGRFGQPAGVAIGEDGTVTALYDNGETRPIYRIPLATFTNPNGLEVESGTLYRETTASGAPLYGNPGEGPAGTLASGALEQSNVDIGTEFVKSILAGTAYEASLATLRTVDEMQRELIDTKA